ncbi:hypothetical protein J4573_50510 [Actinomadura barringtoniae]|uniref:Ricin B lectin domain-containing protein n=1 Tax=Actinomadura barringtoniae TaxID=1427535 RepID=A0A939PUR6_9ACTN|nr:hypothetical protein [Actinomadura barringtoniae]MBO2455389.1 hypothetical protein [Actinomadura barringtoniae]
MVRTVGTITTWAGAALLAASALGLATTAASAATAAPAKATAASARATPASATAGTRGVVDQTVPALAQGAIPNAHHDKPVRVAFKLTAGDTTSPFKGYRVGDVLKITAPPGTTIADLMCGPKKDIAADRRSATCTMPASSFWTADRFVILNVDDNAAGGTVTGKLSYSDPAGRRLTAADLTVFIAGTVKAGTYCKAADLGKTAFTDKNKAIICNRDEDGGKQRWRFPA